MRLAPLFISATLALAVGNAIAADTTGSPTVSPNTTNPQGMSYSDKSSTSPGTNAKMEQPMGSMADKPVAKSANSTEANLGGSYAKTEVNKDGTDTKIVKKTKKSKTKVASSTKNSDTPISAAPTANPVAVDPKTKATDAAAANSTTGRSTGQ